MNKIETLSEFLLQAGTQYRIFDLGRRIQKLNTDDFASFEKAMQPYPYPLQQHAFVGILFWNKQASEQHYIWFLKLPLDEQGLLNQAARNQFLELVVTALGNQLDQQPSKEQQSALDHNPLIFKPSEQKLAYFNSLVKASMKLPPSDYLQDVVDYLSPRADVTQWQHLGLQGLADLVARLDQGEYSQVLAEQLPSLPAEPFCALAAFLENAKVPSAIARVLLTRLDAALADNDKKLALHCLRALSNAQGEGFRSQALDVVLDSGIAGELDTLAIIAGRCWRELAEPARLGRYLEIIAAEQQDVAVFHQLYADLVAIPLLRPHMLAALRNPERSPALAKAIAGLFSGTLH